MRLAVVHASETQNTAPPRPDRVMHAPRERGGVPLALSQASALAADVATWDICVSMRHEARASEILEANPGRPRVRGGLVARARLVRRLTGSADLPLALVVAP